MPNLIKCSEGYDFSNKEFILPKNTYSILKKFCLKNGFSVETVLIFTLSLLFHKYQDTNHILLYSRFPFANDHDKNVILNGGTIESGLPVRINLSVDHRILTILENIENEFANTKLNSYKLQENEYRDSEAKVTSHLLEMAVVFKNNIPGFRGISCIDSNIPLYLIWGEDDADVSFCIRYNAKIFSPGTIDLIFERINYLSGEIIKAGNISHIQYVSESERYKLLEEWNNTDREYPRDETIDSVFERIARQFSQKTALVFNDKVLTYYELNRLSNRVANYLKKKGVCSETIVGICVERSLEMVICILSVLKAGGTYLPLDPAYSVDRLNFMLKDTKTTFLLTQEKLLEYLPKSIRNTICFETLEKESCFFSEKHPEAKHQAFNLAYIMYTSGSTGELKGVEITHRNVLRLVKNTNYAKLDKDGVILNYAPMSFDAATFELWAALLNGGQVVVCPAGNLSNIELGRIIKKYNVSIVWLTAALFHNVVENNIEILKPVKQLIAGGDTLFPKTVKKALEEINGISLINGYGPTENTTFTCCYHIKKGSTFGASVPIGRPIANTKAYVLDRNMTPVPIGVAGELYTAGDGVARGYHNRPRLTKNVFLENPFSKNTNSKIYKTGDWVRYLPDGNIQFIGRIDNQIKLRGFRIKLGEIEHRLSQHEAVEQVLTMIREDYSRDKRLVAYYIVKKKHEDYPKIFRSFLKKQLPEYMIPQHFIELDSFPINADGKIDRKKLPSPKNEYLTARRKIKPRIKVESTVLNIWQDVLGVANIGIRDNFFYMGGHSLSAVAVVSKLTILYDIHLPLAAFLKVPTIEHLSLIVSRALSSSDHKNKKNAPDRIQPVHRNENIGLSATQSNLWYLYRLNPESTVYNLPYAMRMRGKLELPLFNSALNAVINRHESLRTIFKLEKNISVQVVIEPFTLEIPIIDFSHLGKRDREKQTAASLYEQAKTPFDLKEKYNFRASIIKMTDDEYIFFFMPHHIVFDGTSFEIFYDELFKIYAASIKGHTPDLQELPIQYADYAHWQQQWIKTDDFKLKLSYWVKKLKGLPVLQMQTDYPRPAVLSPAGANMDLFIPSDQIQRLTVLGKKESSTLFMVLLAAYSILLYRYTGQKDICIGSAGANRVIPETTNVIGFFASTIILRTENKGVKTFVEHLKGIRNLCIEAYSNQEVPFEEIVKELNPERDFSGTPLFQTLFVVEPFFENEGSIDNIIQWRQEPVCTSIAHTDLTVWISKRSNGYNANFEFSTDLFSKDTIERLLNNFNTLINGIVTNPDLSIEELPLLTESEKKQQLIHWNATDKTYSKNKCLHASMEEQALRTPDKPAVVFENTTLTYSQLNKRSNQLANYLSTIGVGPNIFVGLYFTHSLEMVIAMFGVLKAGGTYTPIDPEYPEGRIQYMLESTNPTAIVTNEKLSSRLLSYDIPLVCVNKDRDKINKYSDKNPEVEIASKIPAYTIFTSGSTGKPKGVLVRHRNVMNFLHSMKTKPGLTEQDIVLAHSSFSFDISILEIFLPLAVGAKVIVIGKEIALDGIKLNELLLKRNVTVMQATPATWQLLLLAGWQGSNNLKILIGAEPVPRGLINALLPKSSSVWNMYGPTETTVWCSCEQIQGTKGPVFIGRPIANTQIFILDKRMNPVPISVPGEIYIGGDGVSRGYLNRPDLNAEVFLPDPFSKKGNSFIYKTGDLGRYHPDGRLEYLARRDKQVKVRGFRIELGEIEAVLCEHDTVYQSVVIVREDKKENTYLVAYIIKNAEHKFDAKNLRSHLQYHLPKYMIPQHFVEMDRFPLTPSRKIDQNNLPAPSDLGEKENQGYIEPRTSIEKLVSRVWEEELVIEKISIKDNFFDIGGHSLVAVTIFSKLSHRYGLNLPLTTLFKAGSIEQLARVIEGLTDEQNLYAQKIGLDKINFFSKKNGTDRSPCSHLVKIQTKGNKPPLFCIHAVGGNVLNYNVFVSKLGLNQPIFGLQSRGLDGRCEPYKTIETMAKEYIQEIKTVQFSGPYYICGGSMGGLIAFEIAQQLKREGEKISFLAMFDTFTSDVHLMGLKKSFQKLKNNSLKNQIGLVLKKISSISLKIGKHFLSRSYLYARRPIPHKLRFWFVESQNKKANLRYHVKPYDGDIILFFSTLNDEHYIDQKNGWIGYIGGRIDAIGIPSKHNTFIENKVFLEKLKETLDQSIYPRQS